jgi:Gram-negative bacterial TonB protein C-terminal
MIKHIWRVMIALLTCMVASAAFAETAPITLSPTSNWEVNYADDSCRMGRRFGTGPDEVTIIFDRYGPGDAFRLILTGKRFDNAPEGRTLEIQFGPGELMQKLEYFPGSIGKGQPSVSIRPSLRIAPFSPSETETLRTSPPNTLLPRIGPERGAAVTFVALGRPLRKPVRLATGSMRKPFEALDTCVNELMTHWGIDVARHATIVRGVTPVTSPGKWLTSNDYPLGMLVSGGRGIVNFRLSVGEDGKPTACHIQQSTRPKAFDDAVCAGMMRRARFYPALDKDAKPIASFYRNTVVFSTGS